MASAHPDPARDDEPAGTQARSGRSYVLASIFDLSPSAIAFIDAGTLRCVYANATCRRLLGDEGPMVGRPLEESWPSADAGALAFLRRAISTGETVHAEELEFRTQRRDAVEPRWFTLSFVPTRDSDGLVEGVLLTATDVTRHHQARAWTEASHGLTEALSGALTQAEVARVVCEKGLAVFGADAGALVLACPEAPGEVEIVEQFGYPAPLIESWRRFPLTLHSPVTEAIRTAAPVWVPSPRAALEGYPDWAPAVASGRDRAWAALPLEIGGTVLGALGLAYYHERQFDEEYRSLMSSVAHRCAQALARAHALDHARASEAALRRAHERLRLAQDAAGIGIHDYDVASNRIGWDARVREIWGIGPHEPVTYDTFLSGVHPDDRASTQAAVDRALDPTGPGAYRAEFRVRSRADGAERWIAATGRVEFQGGKPVRLVGTVLDITERRRDEEAARYQASLLDQMGDAVVSTDDAFRVKTWNHAAELAYGFTRDEAIGRNVDELLRTEFVDVPPDESLRRLLRNEAVRSEVVHHHRDGTGRHVQAHVAGLLGPDGRLQGTLGILRDVTQWKALEADRAAALDALRESEARFKALADGTPVLIWVTDHSGRVEFVNRAYSEFFGMAQEQIRREGWQPPLHPDDLEPTTRVVADAFRRRIPFRVENRVQRKDGEWRWIESSGVPRTADDGVFVGMAGSTVDVTERRRAEEALRTSQERLVLALAAGRVGIWEWDLRAKTVYWTPETHEIMGFSPGEFPGDEQVFFDLVHPDDRSDLSQRLQAAFDREEPYAHQFRIRRPDGTVRWVSNMGRVLPDGSGRPAKMVGTVRDITEEREAEAALRDVDRRRTEFLAILSHELRNPLAPLRNSLVLLDRAPPDSDVARRAREVLRRQTNQLSRLVDDLLDVARIANGKVQLHLARIDARDVVRRACDDVRSLYEQRGVALRYTEAAEPAWVDADSARLSQMVGNLLHNALKFTPPGGRVEVLIQRREDTCEVAVRDTGVGIASDELPRLFAPFMQAERTRGRSQGGLGIGLSLVHELATRHGGAVQARSAGVGHGAEFTVQLPLRAAPTRDSTSARLEPAVARLSVLVVEDGVDAGASLVDLLGLMGHSARLATNGRDGVREALRELPDVLLCDVGLPDMSGHDVIREIRSRVVAALFAVALTGYAQPGDRQGALDAGFDAHLAKPTDFDQLTALLANVAARKSAGG